MTFHTQLAVQKMVNVRSKKNDYKQALRATYYFNSVTFGSIMYAQVNVYEYQGLHIPHILYFDRFLSTALVRAR